MSDPKQPGASNRNGQPSRPRWDRAEESCGDFITALPGGKTVWMAKGPAAKVWRDPLSPAIRKLLQSDKFLGVGVSFFLYMMGKDKSTSRPNIIFCSSDMKARRAVRDAVRASGILEPFPAIGLGDSSSPLTRSDSGLYQNTPQPSAPTRPRSQQPGKGEEGAAPQETRATPSAVTQGSGKGIHVTQDGCATLTQRFTGLTIANCSSSSLSLNDSVASSSARSGRACSISCTPGTSVDGVSLAHRRDSFDASTVKGPDSDTPSSGTETSEELSNDDIDDEGEEEKEEESVVTSSPDVLQSLGHELLERIIGKLLDGFDSYRPRTVPIGSQGSGSSRSGAPQLETWPSGSGHHGATDNNSETPTGKRRLSGEEGSGSGITAAGSKRAKTEPQREKMLACPYWKKDSGKYACCFKWKFKEVKRMKQHLRRCHIKIRCPRCQEDFRDADSRDLHIRAGICALQPDVVDERMNERQIKKLGARGPANQTQYDRWYVVWDILFPGIAKPDSPFIDDDIPEGLCEFLEFFNRTGRDIILDHMRTSEDWHELYDEDRFGQDNWTHIFGGILPAAIERWLQQRDGRSESDTGEGATGVAGVGDASTGVALDPSPGPSVEGDNIDNRGNENQNSLLDSHFEDALDAGNEDWLPNSGSGHVPSWLQ